MKTYSDNYQYPDLWYANDRNWTYEYNNKENATTVVDKECKIWEVIETDNGLIDNDMNTGDEKTEFKQSYYNHTYNENEFINSAYYHLIFENTKQEDIGYYWLAGRCVHLDATKRHFNLHVLYTHNGTRQIGGTAMCYSDRNFK